MPIYEYVPESGECEQCDGRFEQVQGLHEPQLTECPTCQQPCRRALSTFHSKSGRGDILRKSNLEEKGFTQYTKSGKGQYRKTAGRGPDKMGKK
jgi:putative FmdB family regulatory protein